MRESVIVYYPSEGMLFHVRIKGRNGIEHRSVWFGKVYIVTTCPCQFKNDLLPSNEYLVNCEVSTTCCQPGH